MALDDRKQHVRELLEEAPLMRREIVDRIRPIQRDHIIVAPLAGHQVELHAMRRHGLSLHEEEAVEQRVGGGVAGERVGDIQSARVQARRHLRPVTGSGRAGLRECGADRAEAAHAEIAVRRGVGEFRNADLVDGDRRADQAVHHAGKASAPAGRDRFADVCEQSAELHERIPDETLKLRLARMVADMI
ncbi:hypothetical protein [Burkholderia ambifaria]|uniref:hypothetical protein n=1 Tax=Burkholderia ambifaria TaxID=152480 RepID=UPI001E2BC618|nr:hypothetical protein [Burkholderia ambifaria]